MDRAWKSGAIASPPLHTENTAGNFPTGGNPSLGTPATTPGPYWFHQITEELRAVIVAAGLTPDKASTTQLLEALQAMGLFQGPGGDDEPFTTLSIVSNTLTFNLNAFRVFKVTANANITTTTIQNPPAGTKVGQFLVKYTADGTLRTWNWFTSSVVWQHGIVPTLTSTNAKRDWFLFWTDDGGTTWFGQVIGQNF